MNRLMMYLVCGITILVTMGISSLLPSLPLIASVFDVPEENAWHIITAFALPGLVLIPPAGVLADRYGRKAVLVPSLFLFAIGGVCCAAAQTYSQLLALRFVQGAGSAPLGLLYATVIADTWQGEERLKAMSLSAATLGIGTAVSPALGGALAALDWRLPFLLPLAALLLVPAALRAPLARPARSGTLRNYLRAVLDRTRDKQTARLLRLTLLTFIMLSGPIITCLPLLMRQSFNAGPLESGLIIACASLAAGLMAAALPQIYKRLSPARILLAAMLLYTAAFCAVAATPRLWLLVVPITLYGMAQGLNIPLVSTLLSDRATEGERASLMAANAILLRVGQNIGPVLFGLLAGCIGPAAAIASGSVVAAGMAMLVAAAPLPGLRRSGDSKETDPA